MRRGILALTETDTTTDAQEEARYDVKKLAPKSN